MTKQLITFVMTDIHGCLDLLDKALLYIKNYTENEEYDYRIVFTGDYVDRGPDSAGVLDRLMELEALSGLDGRPSVTVLKGNHEEMFHDAMNGRNVSMFLGNGGTHTINSYRVDGKVDMDRVNKHLYWIEGLKYIDVECVGDEDTGTLRVYVHAGINHEFPLDYQIVNEVLWMRSRRFFLATREEMGCYVVHGHTPVHEFKKLDKPEVTDSRTNLDVASPSTKQLILGIFGSWQEKPIELVTIK